MARKHWIDFLEAIRTVVRLLPDGVHLADIMTDEWIKGSWGALERCHGPVDEDWYIAIYGEDFEATRNAANQAYKQAVEILESVLSEGKITGYGICCKNQEEGQRLITGHEMGGPPDRVEIGFACNTISRKSL
jgi:hypothetical protein